MTRTELKPCPFCGSEAIVWMQAGHAHYLECSHCGGRIRPHIDKAEAIEAWNRRAERTAKVQELQRRSETSLDWEGICSNCGAYTNHDMNYCFECGAKLEWK